MQSASDDDVRKRFPEKPRFELVAKCAFRLGRFYISDRSPTAHMHSDFTGYIPLFGHPLF